MGYRGAYFVVGVPDRSAADYLDHYQRSFVEKILTEVTKQKTTIYFTQIKNK